MGRSFGSLFMNLGFVHLGTLPCGLHFRNFGWYLHCGSMEGWKEDRQPKCLVFLGDFPSRFRFWPPGKRLPCALPFTCMPFWSLLYCPTDACIVWVCCIPLLALFGVVCTTPYRTATWKFSWDLQIFLLAGYNFLGISHFNQNFTDKRIKNSDRILNWKIWKDFTKNRWKQNSIWISILTGIALVFSEKSLENDLNFWDLWTKFNANLSGWHRFFLENHWKNDWNLILKQYSI